jgi:hypothetical protein
MKYHGAVFKAITPGYVNYRVEWRNGKKGLGYYWMTEPKTAFEEWEWIGKKDSDVVAETYLFGELSWVQCKKSVLKQYFS